MIKSTHQIIHVQLDHIHLHTIIHYINDYSSLKSLLFINKKCQKTFIMMKEKRFITENETKLSFDTCIQFEKELQLFPSLTTISIPCKLYDYFNKHSLLNCIQSIRLTDSEFHNISNFNQYSSKIEFMKIELDEYPLDLKKYCRLKQLDISIKKLIPLVNLFDDPEISLSLLNIYIDKGLFLTTEYLSKLMEYVNIQKINIHTIHSISGEFTEEERKKITIVSECSIKKYDPGIIHKKHEFLLKRNELGYNFDFMKRIISLYYPTSIKIGTYEKYDVKMEGSKYILSDSSTYEEYKRKINEIAKGNGKKHNSLGFGRYHNYNSSSSSSSSDYDNNGDFSISSFDTSDSDDSENDSNDDSSQLISKNTNDYINGNDNQSRKSSPTAIETPESDNKMKIFNEMKQKFYFYLSKKKYSLDLSEFIYLQKIESYDHNIDIKRPQHVMNLQKVNQEQTKQRKEYSEPYNKSGGYKPKVNWDHKFVGRAYRTMNFTRFQYTDIHFIEGTLFIAIKFPPSLRNLILENNILRIYQRGNHLKLPQTVTKLGILGGTNMELLSFTSLPLLELELSSLPELAKQTFPTTLTQLKINQMNCTHLINMENYQLKEMYLTNSRLKISIPSLEILKMDESTMNIINDYSVSIDSIKAFNSKITAEYTLINKQMIDFKSGTTPTIQIQHNELKQRENTIQHQPIVRIGTTVSTTPSQYQIDKQNKQKNKQRLPMSSTISMNQYYRGVGFPLNSFLNQYLQPYRWQTPLNQTQQRPRVSSEPIIIDLTDGDEEILQSNQQQSIHSNHSNQINQEQLHQEQSQQQTSEYPKGIITQYSPNNPHSVEIIYKYD